MKDRYLAYIHSDHLNSPTVATNQTQSIVWRWQHEAFGKGNPANDPDADGHKVNIPLRFVGQYKDGESGLFYNYYRYYNPSTGRYVTSDPIGLNGGINTYGYVGQNPASRYDRDGLFWEGISPTAYHGVGQFVDWALYHANNDINTQGGWRAGQTGLS